jgi:copper chaperone CopZ
MVQSKAVKPEPIIEAVPTSRRARGILDLSRTKLGDRPFLLEEKLRKTRGVIDAEINVFSNRITIEFDPSLISLEKIKASLASSNGSQARDSDSRRASPASDE